MFFLGLSMRCSTNPQSISTSHTHRVLSHTLGKGRGGLMIMAWHKTPLVISPDDVNIISTMSVISVEQNYT